MNFKDKVFTAVNKIPKGYVASYSQIAVQAGSPRACRAVGTVLHSNPSPKNAPCHRVVGNNGKLAEDYVFGGKGKQQALLINEGVGFTPHGRVDMRRYRHIFPQPEELL